MEDDVSQHCFRTVANMDWMAHDAQLGLSSLQTERPAVWNQYQSNRSQLISGFTLFFNHIASASSAFKISPGILVPNL